MTVPVSRPPLTVVRHINELEKAGIVEADTSGKAKRVRATVTAELLAIAGQTE